MTGSYIHGAVGLFLVANYGLTMVYRPFGRSFLFQLNEPFTIESEREKMRQKKLRSSSGERLHPSESANAGDLFAFVDK